MITVQTLRRWLTSVTFRVGVGLGLLALLFSQIDLRAMIAAIGGIRIELLAILVTIILATRLIGAFRWYVLLHGLNESVSYLAVLRLTFVSDFMGYFSPGSLAVEAIRLYGMSRITSDAALSATSMLVERIVALLALIVLVLVGLAFELPEMPWEVRPLAWLALALLGVGLAALMTRPVRLATLWLLSHPSLSSAQAAARKVYWSLDQYQARPALLAVTFLIAVVFQLSRCITVAIGAYAFGVHLPIEVYLVIVPVIILVTLLPISIAGLGVRELGFVYLFAQFGMSAEVALSLSLLIRLLTLLTSIPGAWFYVRRGVVA